MITVYQDRALGTLALAFVGGGHGMISQTLLWKAVPPEHNSYNYIHQSSCDCSRETFRTGSVENEEMVPWVKRLLHKREALGLGPPASCGGKHL